MPNGIFIDLSVFHGNQLELEKETPDFSAENIHSPISKFPCNNNLTIFNDNNKNVNDVPNRIFGISNAERRQQKNVWSVVRRILAPDNLEDYIQWLHEKSVHQPFLEYLKSNHSNNSSESGSAGSPEPCRYQSAAPDPCRYRSASAPGNRLPGANQINGNQINGNQSNVNGNQQLNVSNQNLGPIKRRSPRPNYAKRKGLSGFAAAAKQMQTRNRPARQYRLFKM